MLICTHDNKENCEYFFLLDGGESCQCPCDCPFQKEELEDGR
jgi:hypothetical protein